MKGIIGESQLSIRNRIIHLTFPRSEPIVKKITDISGKIRWDTDDLCLINQGSGEVTVIIDEYNYHHFDSIRSHILDSKEKLALLTVKESGKDEKVKGIDVPGLYAYFITQLSKKGINIIEIISTSSQLSFIIEESVASNAYNILNSCVTYCKNTGN